MKLIMENWKKFLEEQSQSSNLEIIEKKPFCFAGKCRADVQAVNSDTRVIVAAAGSVADTKEEALASAREKLKIKLQKLKSRG